MLNVGLRWDGWAQNCALLVFQLFIFPGPHLGSLKSFSLSFFLIGCCRTHFSWPWRPRRPFSEGIWPTWIAGGTWYLARWIAVHDRNEDWNRWPRTSLSYPSPGTIRPRCTFRVKAKSNDDRNKNTLIIGITRFSCGRWISQVQRRASGVRQTNLREAQERRHRSSDGATRGAPVHQGHGVVVQRESAPGRHCRDGSLWSMMNQNRFFSNPNASFVRFPYYSEIVIF